MFCSFRYHRRGHEEVPWQERSQAKDEEYDPHEAAAKQKRKDQSAGSLTASSWQTITITNITDFIMFFKKRVMYPSYHQP